jgi:uncharacterized membrane-anchored protein YitT (DUF2179 family)
MIPLFRLAFAFVYLNGVAVFAIAVAESFGLASDGTLTILWLFAMAALILNIILFLFYVNHIGKRRERTLK